MKLRLKPIGAAILEHHHHWIGTPPMNDPADSTVDALDVKALLFAAFVAGFEASQDSEHLTDAMKGWLLDEFEAWIAATGEEARVTSPYQSTSLAAAPRLERAGKELEAAETLQELTPPEVAPNVERSFRFRDWALVLEIPADDWERIKGTLGATWPSLMVPEAVAKGTRITIEVVPNRPRP